MSISEHQNVSKILKSVQSGAIRCNMVQTGREGSQFFTFELFNCSSAFINEFGFKVFVVELSRNQQYPSELRHQPRKSASLPRRLHALEMRNRSMLPDFAARSSVLT